MRTALLLFSCCWAAAACAPPDEDGGLRRRSPAVTELDARMWNQAALARYQPADRAYVMGHATAVYLYGKALPGALAPVGILYRPGKSAPNARVPYDWIGSVSVISGGSDGSGGVIEDYGTPTDSGGGAAGYVPTDVGTKGPISSGPPGTGVSGASEQTDEPWLDGDCETFLDPAAMQARAETARVDVDAVLGEELLGWDARTARGRFKTGMAEALYLEDRDEDTRYSEVEAMKEPSQQAGLCEHSPLVLDLDGDGVRASTIADGVRFDLLDSGRAVRTAWPLGDDALLAMDRDGDGQITRGEELFSNSRHARGRYDDGFASLATLDTAALGGNGDGQIDRADARFAALRIWRDRDRDGVSQPGELVPLGALRVSALSLAARSLDRRDQAGNAHRAGSSFTMTLPDGSRAHRELIDVWFRYRPVLEDALAAR